MTFKSLLIKLFYRFLILFAFLYCIDFALGKMLKHFYFTQKSGFLYRTTYSMDITKADVLVFGSSRANHHYDTRILSDSLGMSCYNTGRDGNGLLFNYAVFETIIRRYTPKIIMLDLGRNELNVSAGDYERLTSLLPYMNRNKVVSHLISLRGPYEKVKCFAKIYPYNSMLLTIAIGNVGVNKKRKSDINGFIPLDGVWKYERADIDSNSVNTIDQNKRIALFEIIKNCKAKGIRLVLINSPAFIKLRSILNINPVEEIAVNCKVEYLDFSFDSTFLENHELFVDPGHLNQLGAKIFTERLVKYLKEPKATHLSDPPQFVLTRNN